MHTLTFDAIFGLWRRDALAGGVYPDVTGLEAEEGEPELEAEQPLEATPEDELPRVVVSRNQRIMAAVMLLLIGGPHLIGGALAAGVLGWELRSLWWDLRRLALEVPWMTEEGLLGGVLLGGLLGLVLLGRGLQRMWVRAEGAPSPA